MTEFYFIRHGETQVNLRHAFNGGGIDEPLTARGVAAATAAGRDLAATRFTQVLASSLPRAMTTARLIMAESQAPQAVTPVAGLRELSLGRWEGQTVEDVAEPQALDCYFHRPAEFDRRYAAARGMETYAHLLSRCRAVVDTAYAAHPTGKILVVAHGIAFQFLLNSLMGVAFDQLRQPAMLHNATISQLDTRDGQHFSKRQWDRTPQD